MVTPLPAGTVILLRTRSDEMEVLMVRRNPALAFMGGFWTFPGGKLEPSDSGLEDAARRELMEEVGIGLAPDAELVLFARWITPVQLPKRFDTHFFVAAGDGTPEPDGSEIVEARWVTLAEAEELERPYPTRKNLERVAQYTSIAEVIAAARSEVVETILLGEVTNDGSPAPAVSQRS